jgi:hypothetical protein
VFLGRSLGVVRRALLRAALDGRRAALVEGCNVLAHPATVRRV